MGFLYSRRILPCEAFAIRLKGNWGLGSDSSRARENG